MAGKIAAAMVGCGGMSGAWLHAARKIPGLEVVALVDLRREAAEKRAVEFGLQQAMIGTDLKAVLARIAPDVVFDCTVPAAHVGVVLTALQHGCHVLGEKPMADTLANARKMVAAARKARRIYAVIQNYRYNEKVCSLKSFLASGKIGAITTVNCDFYLGPHFGGFRDRMQHPLLLDMAIHTFDAARFITGADARAVFCKAWNPRGSWYAHDASAAAIFEMTRGIVFNYRGSWCAEGLWTPWSSEWRIIGEQGSVQWFGAEVFKSQVVAKSVGSKRGHAPDRFKDAPVPVRPVVAQSSDHLGLMREFVACVRSGGTPETVCTDNIKSLAMVFGAVESARRKQWVRVRA